VLVVSECYLLANIEQAREAEPYLARFEDDWATGQILRQYINGKRKYETAKANGKAKVGGKHKRTSTEQLLSPSDKDIVRESLIDATEEWTGVANHGDEMDAVSEDNGDNEDVILFRGSDSDDFDS
jgi:hypothetical protein